MGEGGTLVTPLFCSVTWGQANISLLQASVFSSVQWGDDAVAQSDYPMRSSPGLGHSKESVQQQGLTKGTLILQVLGSSKVGWRIGVNEKWIPNSWQNLEVCEHFFSQFPPLKLSFFSPAFLSFNHPNSPGSPDCLSRLPSSWNLTCGSKHVPPLGFFP